MADPPTHLAIHLLKGGGWPAGLAAIIGTIWGAVSGPAIWVKSPLCTSPIGCPKTLDGGALSAHIGLALTGLFVGALVGWAAAQALIAVGVPKEALGAEGMFD